MVTTFVEVKSQGVSAIRIPSIFQEGKVFRRSDDGTLVSQRFVAMDHDPIHLTMMEKSLSDAVDGRRSFHGDHFCGRGVCHSDPIP